MPTTSKKPQKSRAFKNETAFRNWAKAELEARYGTNVYVHVPQTLARRGDPDLILCFCGLFVPLELKLDGAKKDPSRERLQEFTIGKMWKAGIEFGHARVTPTNWGPIVIPALDALLKERAECMS